MLLHVVLAACPLGLILWKDFALLTPHRTIMTLRFITAMAVCVLLVLTLGPFQGLEARVGMSDKAAHCAAFYILTLLVFAVAPNRRRADIALLVLGLGVLIELAQGVLGRSLSMTDLLADAVGVAAATAPAWVERLRYLGRRHPYLSFAAAKDMDRRRRVRHGADLGPRHVAKEPRALAEDGWR